MDGVGLIPFSFIFSNIMKALVGVADRAAVASACLICIKDPRLVRGTIRPERGAEGFSTLVPSAAVRVDM
jgi:hypothetical protein